LVTLASATVVRAVDAQKPGATGTVVNGRVVVQVFVTLSDDETLYSPVAGLGLGFFQSPKDTAFTVTDGSGSAIILLPPGNYRLVSLSPTRWKGTTYAWSVPVVVQPYMKYIDLRRKEATVSATAVTAAPREPSRVQPAIDPPQVLATAAEQRSTQTTVAAAPAPVAYVDQGSRIVQSAVERSRSTGFYLGLGLEGNGLVPNESGSMSESGGGLGLVLGYGFGKRFSLYAEMSGATMEYADGSGSYALAHADLGTRVHFRAGPNVVVPFLQVGLSGRTMAVDFNDFSGSGSGGGISLGGGLNAHLSPSAAFSATMTWTVGKFDRWAGNWSDPGYSMDATSARLHLGMVWFPN
jgi:hypothetical protein